MEMGQTLRREGGRGGERAEGGMGAAPPHAGAQAQAACPWGASSERPSSCRGAVRRQRCLSPPPPAAGEFSRAGLGLPLPTRLGPPRGREGPCPGRGRCSPAESPCRCRRYSPPSERSLSCSLPGLSRNQHHRTPSPATGPGRHGGAGCGGRGEASVRQGLLPLPAPWKEGQRPWGPTG